MPRLYVELFEAWRAGDIERAQELQFEADRIILITRKYANGIIAASKVIMRLLGVECGSPRAPIMPFSHADQENLKDELEQAGFFSMAPGANL
jgi:N-acetylneuraminate lyase